MSTTTKRLVAAGFVLFLFLPLLGRLLGIEPEPIENRPIAKRPTVTAKGLLATDFYQGMSSHIVDTHPWRKDAVAAAAWLNLELFGDSPSPRVHVGREGWLFFDDALRMPCGNKAPLPQLLMQLGRLSAVLEESGRDFGFLITPNKSSIYPEFMSPRVRRLEACSARKRTSLRSHLAEAGLPGYVDLFAKLDFVKADGLLYFPNDSHLNSFGSVAQTRAIIRLLRPELWQPEDLLAPKKRAHIGDLTRLMGLPSGVATERYVLKRRDVQLVRQIETDLGGPPPLRRYVSTGTSSDLIASPTLFLHDSQLNLSMPMLRQFFADVSFIHWNQFDPEVVSQLMAESSLVMLQVVERGFYNRMAYQIGAPGFLEELESRLEAGRSSTVAEKSPTHPTETP